MWPVSNSIIKYKWLHLFYNLAHHLTVFLFTNTQLTLRIEINKQIIGYPNSLL